MVSVPGKAIGPVTSLLQTHLEEGSQQLLTEFHKLVVQKLTAQSPEDDDGTVQQQLDAKLPALKAVAGIVDAAHQPVTE